MHSIHKLFKHFSISNLNFSPSATLQIEIGADRVVTNVASSFRPASKQSGPWRSEYSNLNTSSPVLGPFCHAHRFRYVHIYLVYMCGSLRQSSSTPAANNCLLADKQKELWEGRGAGSVAVAWFLTHSPGSSDARIRLTF